MMMGCVRMTTHSTVRYDEKCGGLVKTESGVE